MNDGQIIIIIGLDRFKNFDKRCLAEIKKISPLMLEEALRHGVILPGAKDARPIETISFGKLESFVKALVAATQEETHWFTDSDPDGFPTNYSEVMSEVDEGWRLSTDGIFFRSRCRALWMLCEATQHDKIRKFIDLHIQNYTDEQKKAVLDVLDFMEHTKTGLPPAPKIEVQDHEGNVHPNHGKLNKYGAGRK